MSFRFRKSFKIFPGVRLNIGKSGVSGVNIGRRGASVTVGKRGVYGNTGIPGTGVSYRQRLGGQSNNADISRGSSFTSMFVAGFILSLLIIGGLLVIGFLLAIVAR